MSARLLIPFLCLLACLFLFWNVASGDNPAFVLPPQSQSSIQRLTDDPFPPVCGAELDRTEIQGDKITLHFTGSDSFVIDLLHPSASVEAPVVGWFKVDSSTAPCRDFLPVFRRLSEQRPIDTPWIPVETERAPSPDYSLFFLGIVVGLALLWAPYGIGLWYAGQDRRWVWALALGIFAAAVRLARPGVIYNWYSVYPNEAWRIDGFTVSPGLMAPLHVLGLIFPGVSLLDISLGLSLLASIGAVLAAVPMAKALGFSQRQGILWAVLLAAWPILTQLGRSDSAHNLTLMVWFAGGLAYARALKGSPRFMIPACLSALACAGLRVEAMLWPLAWLLLFVRLDDLSSFKRGLFALSPVFVLPLILPASRSLVSGQSGTMQFEAFLHAPLHLWQSLTLNSFAAQSGLILMGLGLILMNIGPDPKSRFLRTARMLTAMMLLAGPTLFSGLDLENQLTLRYYLPLAALAFLCIAALSSRPSTRPKPLAWLPELLLFVWLVLVWTTEEGRGFSTDKQFTFRKEPAFLMEHLHDKRRGPWFV